MSKNKSVVHISENFTIRKIDPEQIINAYFQGKYKNRGLPEFKVKTSTTIVRVGKDIGKDSSSEIFRFVDRSNNNQSIFTTNHALYKYHDDLQNGKFAESPILRCNYCKRNNLKKPVGIPVTMELRPSEIIFTVIDNFCDFGCAFSHLKRKLSESRGYRGPLYMNAEQLLYCMYYRMYPEREGQMIRDKPDWSLLRENGGPLTDQEFDCDASEYVPVPSVITLPAKKQYLKTIQGIQK